MRAKIKTFEVTGLFQHDIIWSTNGLTITSGDSMKTILNKWVMGIWRMLEIDYTQLIQDKWLSKPKIVKKKLGVLTDYEVSFSEHIDDMVLFSKSSQAYYWKYLKKREAEHMMKMVNAIIQSKIECCGVMWNLKKEEENV